MVICSGNVICEPDTWNIGSGLNRLKKKTNLNGRSINFLLERGIFALWHRHRVLSCIQYGQTLRKEHNSVDWTWENQHNWFCSPRACPGQSMPTAHPELCWLCGWSGTMKYYITSWHNNSQKTFLPHMCLQGVFNMWPVHRRLVAKPYNLISNTFFFRGLCFATFLPHITISGKTVGNNSFILFRRVPTLLSATH